MRKIYGMEERTSFDIFDFCPNYYFLVRLGYVARQARGPSAAAIIIINRFVVRLICLRSLWVRGGG